MASDQAREFPAEQILNQSSAYPPMVDGECQMSTAILSAAYPELRYVKGTRRKIYAVPDTEPRATEVEHCWNERVDGTIIDSAFQPGPITARNLVHVTLRYIEDEISKTEREDANQTIRILRQKIKRLMRAGGGPAHERCRKAVEELRDDLPRFRRDFDPVTPTQPRILRGDDATVMSRPDAPPEDPGIPAGFRKNR